jgi:HEPN domain-containing protein
MPDEANLATVSDWYRHGEDDLQGARILLREGGSTDTIALLIEQSAEKYLKGYLLSKGWKLKKTHDLELLLTEAVDFNPLFMPYLEYSRIVSAFYIEQRYPPSPQTEYPRKEIAHILVQTESLIALIKQKGQVA